jgi:hypothetical protein
MPSPRYGPGAYERQANDYYGTPSWVTELLTNTVRLRGVVWEPCAGQGALAKVIAAAGYKVVATDLVAYDDCVFPVASGIDALQAPLPAPGCGPSRRIHPTTSICCRSWYGTGSGS